MGKMGKMRKKAAKLHASAPKPKADPAKSGDVDMETTSLPPSAAVASSIGGGFFSKMDIDINAIQQRLPTDLDDVDARSSVTNKQLKGLNLTKKDKRKLRHHVWQKKVDALQEAKRETAARKKRQKTAIVGDMKPLEDTLPTLELLLKDTAKHTQSKEPEKPKPVKKEKVRRQEMYDEYALFQKIVNHPTYRENPLSTIKEHLKIRMEMEDS